MPIADPITPLAFSIFEGKGVYALLLGSGMSSAAEVPTGWEITLDLIRKVGLSQGVGEQNDWAAWYREQAGEEPDYSKLLAALASSPDERRAIVHGYIEPSDEDREEGRRIPTRAHHAIADLVASGCIRVIVTTNFDRLLENALRERGIEPTVVASVDAMSGAEPITHSRCYVLKLHGDYKDARILNTDDELSAYPSAYDTLLDRIFDEHGLIICGWSGAWDHALRAAILRAPNRRYGSYWAMRGEPSEAATEIIRHRAARIIPIKDADSFFTTLQQRVETLQHSRQQNPQSIDLMIASTKRLLSRPEHRIQLHEMVAQETEKVLSQLNGESAGLTTQGPYDPQEWRRRVRIYESSVEGLACIAGLLGRWGDGFELEIVRDVVRSLHAHADEAQGGLVPYLELRAYPAVLVFEAYGLGLTRAERWTTLYEFYGTPIHRKHQEASRFIDTLFLWAWSGAENQFWKQLEGLENRKTPLSDHLLDVFIPWSPRFVSLTPDFELTFERFEMLGSLAHFDRNDPTTVLASLSTNPQQGFTWMPIGRSGWHTQNAAKLLAEFNSEPMAVALAQAGFGAGKPEFMDAFVKNFQSVAGRMRW